VSAPPLDKPDLLHAGDTDEVYRLAYELAAWGLRNGECDEVSAVDWTLGHPCEYELPRGSHGRLNPTAHHVTKGAEAAVEGYEPWTHRAEFDPEPLHDLAERISGSGVKHERYLLGVIALCHRFQTLTPVITGPLLAGAVGVAKPVAGRVLAEWSNTLAGGLFTGVTYDGKRGHGRIWTVDPGFMPVPKLKHDPGCNRSRSRCSCRTTGDLSFTAAKDRSPNPRQPAVEFAEWLATLGRRTPLTVSDVAKQLGVTRAAATKLLRSQQGKLLDEFTHLGSMTRKRTRDGNFAQVRTGETWFVGRP
jgi:hypothetical protein